MAKDRQQEPAEFYLCPNDPNPFSGPAVDGRASDDAMGNLHGRTEHEISRLLTYGNVRTKLATLGYAIRFLKDNNCTTQLKNESATNKVLHALPTVEELERLMANSPD
jgi:hypothetical protein